MSLHPWHTYRSILCFSLLCSLSGPALSRGHAQGVFYFNERCSTAYRSILQLKLDEGAALLREEHREHPDNRIVDLLENYIDCITLFFNEEPERFTQFQKDWEIRMDRIRQADAGSAFFLFSQGILYFQKSLVNMKLGHFWSAGWDMHSAWRRFQDNRDKFPRFTPNIIYHSSMRVMAGTIPGGWKWLSQLLGISGEIASGMRQLEFFLKQQDQDSRLFRQEGVIYYSYLKYYVENDRQGVFHFLAQEASDLQKNHLFAYITVNLLLNNQQSAKAAQIIREREDTKAYLQTPMWDFELGNALLHHLEGDAAIFLERFLQSFKGSFYRKDALQKLSWYYFLNNDQAKASRFRTKVLSEGKTQTDPDRQAYREAHSGIWPNPTLLKARLLCDGGYYGEALQLLSGKRSTDFNLDRDRVEFNYRVARIYDETNRKKEAVVFYRETIRLGENRKEYYAARSALQMGLICEKDNQWEQALQWYRKCVDMKDHEYENSLEQRAKAGIGRCTRQ
jgi:tetratricopeptide (TPR) repeat protein